MGKAGPEYQPMVTSLPQHSSIALGSTLLASLVNRNEIPEALFCNDDNLAMGAIMKCREIGIKVPEEISILGFHDLEFAAYASPPLSTVATRLFKIGKLAAEAAVKELLGKRLADSTQIDVGYEIVARQSTEKIFDRR
jgi:LacI family transcriptional regulator, gluconate utilization system Gnt-I transcriptional repressor